MDSKNRFFFLREAKWSLRPSLPSLHVTERQWAKAYLETVAKNAKFAWPTAPLLQMTEILHDPAYPPCNSMHFMHKYSFTAGNPIPSKSTAFCGNVDNALWTIFRPFSLLWKPSKFVHHPCGRSSVSRPRLSDAFPQYFILRVLFLSFILSSPQKRAEHERKGTHPHEVFL